jgi:hypothetical protein
MFFRSTPFRAICSAVIAASLSVAVFGDTIRLKDGSIFKGRIVSFAGGKFVVAIGEGPRKREMTFTAADVESIQFDGPQAERSNAPAEIRTASNVKPSPPASGETSDVKSVYKQPISQPPSRPAAASPPQSVPTRRASTSKPVELNVKVLSDNTANGWTNSGWVVRKGQTIHISGTGEISIGNGKKVSPSGAYDIEDGQKLLKNVPTGALLAVIGDDNNDFIYVGSDREFIAERDGTLFLGINEGNLNDNSGSFDVKIEITPEGGE